jgi:hypothetical protein
MECLLCFEFYDDGKHKPHSINPCGHHFCATCLDKIKNKTCPTCRGNIQSKTLNRGILELINPEVLVDGNNNNKKIRLFKYSLIEEIENCLGEWKLKKENENKKFKTKIKSLIDEIEKDKALKIAKLEADSQKIITRLNAIENVFKRDTEKEIETYFLSIKKRQEQLKNSNDSKLALEHSEALKEEITKKSGEIQNLEEFCRPFVYMKNFNGEHAIGNIVKFQNEGVYMLIK